MSDTSHTWDHWQPCEYFLWRMEVREMKREDIMATLREPDSVLPSEGRLIYQKQLGKKLLRIVTEGNIDKDARLYVRK